MTSSSDLEPKYSSESPLEESNLKVQVLANNVTHYGSLWATLPVLGSCLYRMSRCHRLQYSHVSVFLTLLLLGSRVELEYHLYKTHTYKHTAGGQQRPFKIGFKTTLITLNRGLCYKLCSSLLHAVCKLRSSCQQRMVFLWWQDVYS